MSLRDLNVLDVTFTSLCRCEADTLHLDVVREREREKTEQAHHSRTFVEKQCIKVGTHMQVHMHDPAYTALLIISD